MSRHKIFQNAVALHQQGQLDAATKIYLDIVNTDPNDAECWHMMGVIATQKQEHELAAELMKHALKLNPNNPVLLCNLGFALQAANQLQDALDCYDQAVAIDPNFAQAFYNRANAFKALGQTTNALQNYEQALALNPAYCEAHINSGLTHQELGQQHAALLHFQKAVALQPQLATAHLNCGNAFKALHQLQEALHSYDQAIAIDANYAQAHYNRGTVLQDQLELREAIACYDKAITLDNNYAQAHWNKANCLLLLGELSQAWPLYEWRWKTPSTGLTPRTFKQPLWLGQASVNNKTVLLHSEQGLGDTLQFCRYAQHVARLGARVIIEVPESLFGLLQGLPGVSQWIRQGDPLPDFDLHCPLLSLALALRTTLENIPTPEAYLQAQPDKQQIWSKKLAPKSRLRIGLVWSGSVHHANDQHRSLHLSQILAALPTDVDYVSLQKEIRPHDLPALKQAKHLQHFGDEITSFEDTAALCSLMDLVISVDTSVAHLSGALGQKTWVLLPYVPDWRWMLERTDSPWYLSMHLYRQNIQRDWMPVLEQVSAAITNL